MSPVKFKLVIKLQRKRMAQSGMSRNDNKWNCCMSLLSNIGSILVTMVTANCGDYLGTRTRVWVNITTM